MKKRSWTISQLRAAVRSSTSIRQVIYKIGLIPAGGNYAQVKKYITEHNICTEHFKGRAWNKGMKGIGKPVIPLEQILVRNSHFQSYDQKALPHFWPVLLEELAGLPASGSFFARGGPSKRVEGT